MKNTVLFHYIFNRNNRYRIHYRIINQYFGDFDSVIPVRYF